MRVPSWINLIAGASLLPTGSSWYLEIHNQVTLVNHPAQTQTHPYQIGYVAEQFMDPRTHWMIAQILDPEYGGSIGRAAAWADTVRKTHPYSYGWHFISALDNVFTFSLGLPERRLRRLRPCKPNGDSWRLHSKSPRRQPGAQ